MSLVGFVCAVLVFSCFFVVGVCFVCGVLCCCVLYHWFVVRVCVVVLVS